MNEFRTFGIKQKVFRTANFGIYFISVDTSLKWEYI